MASKPNSDADYINADYSAIRHLYPRTHIVWQRDASGNGIRYAYFYRNADAKPIIYFKRDAATKPYTAS